MIKLKLQVMNRAVFAYNAFSDFLARKWQRKFYVHLAIGFTVFALLDSALLHFTSSIPMATFDPMVRNRLAPPKPDKDIVIVDINEATLSAMSEKYGRYPWPRQVFGEFVEEIEKQHPKAIVFDILFSDPDIRDLKSDAYFDDSIAKTNNTYFPMALLDTAGDDALRQAKLADVPGVVAIPDEVRDPEVKVNVILPIFKSAIAGGRVGTQNVPMDADGVVRHYPNYFEESGWQLPSLPARLGRDFGWPQPVTDRMLLNWRGKPNSFQYVGFADAFLDMTAVEKKRPQDEFKDKIVIIGSTAPNLFDVRVTPMAEMYPGVELLATAIDNYKHADSIRFLEGRLWYLLITLAIIWLTAYAFYREDGRGNIDKLFSLSQFFLIGFSFASINFSDTYINLAGPVMLGIAYFTLARIYATATERGLEQNMVRTATARQGSLQATLLLLRFDPSRNVLSGGMLEKIRVGLRKLGSVQKSVEVMTGGQKGIWGLFEKTVAISWVADVQDEAGQRAIEQDVEQVLQTMEPLLKKFLLHRDAGAMSHVVCQGRVQGGENAAEGWRTLFADALIKWEAETEQNKKIES